MIRKCASRLYSSWGLVRWRKKVGPQFLSEVFDRKFRNALQSSTGCAFQTVVHARCTECSLYASQMALYSGHDFFDLVSQEENSEARIYEWWAGDAGLELSRDLATESCDDCEKKTASKVIELSREMAREESPTIVKITRTCRNILR